MEFASALYKGGDLVAAQTANYESYKELGCICPFCKENVFLAREHDRNGSLVRASWRHYKLSANTSYCENRALSAIGKELLEKFKPQARNQRLRLFNRRFWDIFTYKKYVPKNLKAACLQVVGDSEILTEIVKNCRATWDVELIIKHIPQNPKIDVDALTESILQHPSLSFSQSPEFAGEIAQELLAEHANVRTSALNHKISCEVVAWLKTPTARPAFEKVIQVALLDCAEVLPQPVKVADIVNMALANLVWSNWSEAIDSLKGVGFG